MISIRARIEPVPYARVRTNKGRHFFNPERYRSFKEEMGWQARLVIAEPTTKPLAIRVRIYREMPPESLRFGDIDNHLKAVLDSLNGIAFVDDRQVVSAQITLHRGNPRIEIELEELQ